MPEIEKKETRTEARMSGIETGIKEIKDSLGNITRKLLKFEESVKEQTDRIIKIEEICIEYAEMKKELDEVKAENRALKNRMNMVEEKIRWKEKIEIKNKAEIFGIPKRINENPKEIVVRLARAAKVEIREEDMQECFRVKARDETQRQIVIEFKSYEKKAELVKAIKTKKLRLKDVQEQPENKFIYVNEMLTREVKQILYMTKQEAKNKGWYRVWIYAGEVYVLMEEKGRQINIKNLEQLEILLK